MVRFRVRLPLPLQFVLIRTGLMLQLMLYELLIISCCTCSVGCVQPCIPFALYSEVGELPEPSPALPYVSTRMEVSRGLRLSELIFSNNLGFYTECLALWNFLQLVHLDCFLHSTAKTLDTHWGHHHWMVL